MRNISSGFRTIVTIVAVFFSAILSAQNELWYFGTGAGMAFTGPGNSPVSRPGEAAVGFYESLTTIGDGNGNVQWYTDGINVYDATHSIMPNGAGILGPSDGGTGSANQGVLTMPFPGSTTKFVMWTVPATDGTPSQGMRYHVIDMSLNGGLGDLSSKNVLVSGGANVAEMLAGGRVNGNCNVMWAIAHETGSNNFIINKVEQVGGVLTITTNTQSIGPIVNPGGAARGAMDISPDGKQIALCGGWPTGSHMFDFDDVNGVISNHVDLSPKFVVGNQWRYGVFFSPDSKKIYFANGSYGVSPKLVQYNITLDALTTVYNGISNITEFAQGKDGVLYVGKTNGTSLAIMNNPDASTGGGAGFVDNGYPLGGGSLNFGLPQYTYCFLDDPVVCPDTSLAAGPIPNICASGGSTDLSAFQGTAAAGGTWSISNGPAGHTSTVVGTTFNAVESGTYTVRYTLNPDPGGTCGKFAERSLIVNELPSVSVNSESICEGDPAATFTATSATATGWTWSANGTGTNQTTTGTTAGNYTVTVTDGTCNNTATGVLTVNSLPSVSVNSETICDGDPAATFTATSATATGWAWSANGTGTNQTTSGTTAGNYTVTVTDGTCSNTATGVLTVNAQPSVSVNSETICAGDPAVTFTATSATATGWTWSANGTGNNQTTTGSAAGNYTVTVTDGTCSNSATGVLTVNALPAVSVNDANICEGDPAVTFTATAPTAVSYLWSANGSGTNPTTTGSLPGNYTVTVIDANNCENSATGVLTENVRPSVSVNSEEICDGDPAATFTAISATATGWTWSANGTGTNQTTTGTTAGDYTVTVTDGTCSNSATGTLVVNALPEVIVPDQSICAGDAAATFTASSDSTVFSYSWSENGTGSGQTTTGTTAGNYTVTIVDVNGCSDSHTGVLTVNAQPSVSVNSESICEGDGAVTFTATSATATGWTWSANGTGSNQTTTGSTAGDYTVTVTDGSCTNTATGTLTVNFLPSVSVENLSICDGDPAATFTATSATATGWTWSENGTGTQQTTTGTVAGNYTVTVTDGTCSNSATGVLTVNTLPNVSVNNETICEGDPLVTFTATSATATGWTWSENGTGNNQTTEGVIAGNYTVTVTDGNCSNSATGVLTVNALPSISVNSETICEGDPAVTFTATSATATSWTWSANGTGTNQTSTGIAAGDYTVTVTDGTCSNTATGTLTVNPKPNVLLPAETICTGGPAVTFDAGAGYSSYLWSENGTGTGQTTSGTAVGNYTVEVEDANGCRDTATAILTESDVPSASALDGETCGDGRVLCTVENVSPGATVNWYPGSAGGSVVNNGENKTSWLTSPLSESKVFFAEIIDSSSGCTSNARVAVNAIVHEKPSVELVNAVICAGDPAVVFDAGAGYSVYKWSDNGSGTGQTTSGAVAGDYTVEVEDGNGCKDTSTASLTVNPLPNVDLGNDFNVCEGESVTVSVDNYSVILWSDGSGGNTYIANKSEKIYVLVTDGNNCQQADSVVATLVPMADSFSLREDTTICEKARDEVLLFVENQGRSILWQDGSTSQNYLATIAGEYEVTLTDTNGCTASDKVVLTGFCTPITLTMPNIFTPNTDGVNDYMRPLEMEWADKDFMMANILNIKFYVYDRWGIMVHATEGVLPKWDGRAPNGLRCSDGTYFWDLEYTDAAEEKYHLNGFVKLYQTK